MNVAQLVGRTLAELGAGHCFGVVGSGNFAVTNALREHGVPKVHLMVRGENAAVQGFYRELGYEVQEVVVLGKRF